MLRQQTSGWESRLVNLAEAGLESQAPDEPVQADTQALESAYAACESLTQEHSRTFYLASSLLPFEKRRAARALYAFCRVSDDLVDEGLASKGLASQGPGNQDDPAQSINRDDARRMLHDWRVTTLGEQSAKPPVRDAHTPEWEQVALAWADTRARFYVPRLYAEQLIDGVTSDLDHTRYATFGDLAAYCYSVASTVGLMAMHIIGYAGPEAISYAVKLGVALQMTNILRDVGEDWRNGRLYLPQEELEAFQLGEADIARGQVSARWQDFMAYQIERNRRLYAEALPGIQLLDPDGRFAIGAAAELYQAILADIEAHQGDVFTRRAYVSKWGKLRRLPGIWLRTRG